MADPNLRLQLDLFQLDAVTPVARTKAREQRHCARPDCPNDISNRQAGAIYCSRSCYYFVRARRPDRRNYKHEYDLKNQEKRRVYGQRWRLENGYLQYMAHIYAWRATLPHHQYPPVQHIKDYNSAGRPNAVSRHALREIRRSTALKVINELDEVSKLLDLTRKQQRMKQWRQENNKWLKEYIIRYRGVHPDATRRNRRLRRRAKADAAIIVLRELGVKI